MSNDIATGGTAYPTTTLGSRLTGLTKRDWFAGHALTGLLSVEAEDVALFGVSRRRVARLAYLLADAMLDAREGWTD